MGEAIYMYRAQDGKLFDTEDKMKAHEFARENESKVRAFAEEHYKTKASQTKAVNVILHWEANKPPGADWMD